MHITIDEKTNGFFFVVQQTLSTSILKHGCMFVVTTFIIIFCFKIICLMTNLISKIFKVICSNMLKARKLFFCAVYLCDFPT